MALLQQRARAAIKAHNGLRKAARALRINHSTLLYLAEGKRTTASKRVLAALGIVQHYRPASGT
jgi:hypothetical protein